MSYKGRSELIAAVKNKTALKPRPFLVVNNEHDPNYYSLLWTYIKQRFFLYAVSFLKTKYIGNKK